MKIRKPSIQKLRSDAHFQVHTEVKDLIAKTGAETLKIKPLFEGKYLPLYIKEDNILKIMVGSPITERIYNADKERDETYYGMLEVNSGNLKHFNPQVKESARVLGMLFKNYGNVAKKPFNEETSAIYNLLQDLTGKFSADVNRVGLVAWVEELQNRNSAFDTLMKERYEEAATKHEYSMKEVRREIDEVLFAMIGHINADAMVEASDVYDAFIKTLNAIFAKYKSRKYRAGSSGADSGDSSDGSEDVSDDETGEQDELEEFDT